MLVKKMLTFFQSTCFLPMFVWDVNVVGVVVEVGGSGKGSLNSMVLLHSLGMNDAFCSICIFDGLFNMSCLIIGLVGRMLFPPVNTGEYLLSHIQWHILCYKPF